jgi:cation:H+ antiporter
MTVWLQFAVCAAVILIAGSQLSQRAEKIAEKSGWTKSWVGLVLLAIVASSSQLIASIAAAVFLNVPDMAVGALMGSCMFNMLVIGVLDLFSKDRPVSNVVHQGHVLTAGFGIVLLGLAAIDILFGKTLPALHWAHLMDPITIIFIPVYLIAMRLSFTYEQSRSSEMNHVEQSQSINGGHPSWFKLLVPFAIFAAAIIAASGYLPSVAEQIRSQMGWGQSFVGLSFIAITTCLPELSVSTSAARRGSFDVAIASLLGSNLCYMVILAITDFCYTRAPLLRHSSPANALAAMTASISMAIAIIALTYRAEKKLLFIAGDAVALVAVYVFANVLLFVAH